MPREEVAGPESGPRPPFPINIQGKVVKGFGRGSKDLGIPTANIPVEGLDIGGHSDITSGIYYGWCGLFLPTATDNPAKAALAADAPGEEEKPAGKVKSIVHKVTDTLTGHTKDPTEVSKLKVEDPLAPIEVYPAVVSIGYNPYYKNEKRSIEVHVLHKFDGDFYNALMNLSILGFIREEANYDSMQALIDDINIDIEVSRRSLDRPAYQSHSKNPWLLDFTWGPKGHALRRSETEKAKAAGIIDHDATGLVGKLGTESTQEN